MEQQLIVINEATVMREALLAFAKTTLGRERAIAEELAARAEEMTGESLPAYFKEPIAA